MKAEIKRNFVYISRGSKCLHIPLGWRIQAILLLSFPTPTFPPSPSSYTPYPSPYINISLYPSLAYSNISLPLLPYFYTFYHRHIPFSLSFFFLFPLSLSLFLTPSPFSFFSLSPSPYSLLPLPFLSFPSLPRLIPYSLSLFFLFSLSLALFLTPSPFSFFSLSPSPYSLFPLPFLSFPSLSRLINLHFLSSRPRLKGTVNEISRNPFKPLSGQ